MAGSFENRLKDPQHAELSHAEFVGMLVDDEKTYRENRRLKRILRGAKLRLQACLEDVDYRHPRGLQKPVLRQLATIHWIEAQRNVLLDGPTGIGKTFIACALGNLAARAGRTVLYVRAPRLFEILSQARGDGSHLKVLNKLAKVNLLIVDDFLLTPMAEPERKDFLEIVEDRYQAASTVVASQCPFKSWHAGIGDPTLADAICDRLVHNAYKIALTGPSMRGKKEGSS